jgi:hypothetical protein
MQFELQWGFSFTVRPLAIDQRHHLSAYSAFNCFIFIQAYTFNSLLSVASAQFLNRSSRPPTYIAASRQHSNNSPRTPPVHHNLHIKIFQRQTIRWASLKTASTRSTSFGDLFFPAVFHVCGLANRFLCVRFSARF